MDWSPIGMRPAKRRRSAPPIVSQADFDIAVCNGSGEIADSLVVAEGV
jgi:hypothetical protein